MNYYSCVFLFYTYLDKRNGSWWVNRLDSGNERMRYDNMKSEM